MVMVKKDMIYSYLVLVCLKRFTIQKIRSGLDGQGLRDARYWDLDWALEQSSSSHSDNACLVWRSDGTYKKEVNSSCFYLAGGWGDSVIVSECTWEIKRKSKVLWEGLMLMVGSVSISDWPFKAAEAAAHLSKWLRTTDGRFAYI